MTKNIAVTDEIYDRLSKMKRKRDSFSNVKRQLLEQTPNISDIAGTQTFSKDEWKTVQEAFTNQSTLDKLRKDRFFDQVE